MADELLDLVDKNDKVIGTVWKSEVHNNPKLIHREVAIIVFNNNHQTLLQQRSFEKKVEPGCWKITAAGHPESGEDPLIAIKRELFEELGIKVEPIFYKKVFSMHDKEGQTHESRFTWLYYAILNTPSKIELQKSEVNDAKWVSIDDLPKFSINHDYNIHSDFHKIIMEIATKLKII